MRTNRPNWDHDKRVAIIPQLVKVCTNCGGRVYMRTDRIVSCGTCRSTTWELLQENIIPILKRGLLEKQQEAAIHYAASQTSGLHTDMTEDQFDKLHELFLEIAPNLAEAITEEIINDTEWIPEPCGHTPVKVTSSARWFRHGGTHPLSVDGAAYTWCTKCGEIISLDNDVANAAWNAWLEAK